MSVFYCNYCDRCIDSDYVECHEDPADPLELVCADCFDAEFGDDEDGANPLDKAARIE